MYTLMVAGRPNINGRVYSHKSLEETLKTISDQIEKQNCLVYFDSNHRADLDKIAAIVKRAEIYESDELRIEIDVLSSPCGKILEALIAENVGIRFYICGLGKMQDSSVTDYKFTHIGVEVKT